MTSEDTELNYLKRYLPEDEAENLDYWEVITAGIITPAGIILDGFFSVEQLKALTKLIDHEYDECVHGCCTNIDSDLCKSCERHWSGSLSKYKEGGYHID